MIVVLFEDQRVDQLFPITIGKAAFDIHCGSYSLWELTGELGYAVYVLARHHLWEILKADNRAVGLPNDKSAEPALLVNARLVPSIATRERLRQLLSDGHPAAVRRGETLLAALVPPRAQLPRGHVSNGELERLIASLKLPGVEIELDTFEYPHDVIRYHLQTLADNLSERISRGRYEQVADGVFLAAGARLGQYVVTDATAGPIVLEEGATVGPYCLLRGPAHLGAGARLTEHSAIKDCVALGHTTKVGGEVEGSIIEPFTNKQHHGFIGHSYLGSWVNLGAGTCNSDLKNTYGPVNMEYHGHKIATGMQFLGAIIGDYAKTAINTGIFTGKTIGACSMVYGFVTTNVPSFVNYARLFGQVTEAPPDVMVAAQARMFARRQVQQRPCDIQLLHDMYELTRNERQIAGEPLSL